MRMSSFIVGGMVGAALAIYMKKNNQTMMQTLSNIGQFVNTMINEQMSNEQSATSSTGESTFSYVSDEQASVDQMQ